MCRGIYAVGTQQVNHLALSKLQQFACFPSPSHDIGALYNYSFTLVSGEVAQNRSNQAKNEASSGLLLDHYCITEALAGSTKLHTRASFYITDQQKRFNQYSKQSRRPGDAQFLDVKVKVPTNVVLLYLHMKLPILICM